MKVKAVLLALAVAAIAAAGAAADGGPPPPPPPQGGTAGPGGPGGGRPGRPGGPPGQQQPNPNGQGQGEDQGQGGGQGDTGQGGNGQADRTGDRAFRRQLLAAGYRCLLRPAILQGKLSAVGSDSVTVHAMLRRTGAGTDVTVKVLPATLVYRMGPAKLSDLAVGDYVLVAAAVCRSSTDTAGKTGTTGATGTSGTGRTPQPPTLVARRIGARPAATAHS